MQLPYFGLRKLQVEQSSERWSRKPPVSQKSRTNGSLARHSAQRICWCNRWRVTGSMPVTMTVGGGFWWGSSSLDFLPWGGVYMREVGTMWQIGVLTGKPCTFFVQKSVVFRRFCHYKNKERPSKGFGSKMAHSFYLSWCLQNVPNKPLKMAKMCTVSRLERQFATLYLSHAPTGGGGSHEWTSQSDRNLVYWTKSVTATEHCETSALGVFKIEVILKRLFIQRFSFSVLGGSEGNDKGRGAHSPIHLSNTFATNLSQTSSKP